jgi:GT2 family glycosyltransferase
MKNTVAILIPVYNGLSYTKQCIRDIESSVAEIPRARSFFETVVIDDGSTDGTSEFIRNHHPGIHLLQGDGNLWWSGSINKGVEYALNTLRSMYILFWNNDISPGPDFFKAVLEAIKEPAKYPLACSMVYFKDKPDILISTGGYFNRHNGALGLYNYNTKESAAMLENLKIDWCGGMGTLVRSDVFTSIGLLDNSNFPQYHGDSDFGIRATCAGYPIRLIEQMKIWNDTGNSGIHRSMKLRDFIRSFYSIKSNTNIRKDLIFYKKHATSVWSYFYLVKKYTIFLASFVKWKLLGLIGIYKNS